jgi:type II secretory pathway component PulJ
MSLFERYNCYIYVYFNITYKRSRGVGGCQKGFLLIEALLVIALLSVFSLGIMRWYEHCLQVQGITTARLSAMASCSSFLSKIQAHRRVPMGGSYQEGGYHITLEVAQDKQVSQFYWVKAVVDKPALVMETGVWCDRKNS